jgi:hypothetical protein
MKASVSNFSFLEIKELDQLRLVKPLKPCGNYVHHLL